VSVCVGVCGFECVCVFACLYVVEGGECMYVWLSVLSLFWSLVRVFVCVHVGLCL